jgi:hypothetical protein
MPFRYDPKHWRNRAEEMRRLARDTKNASVKQKMLRIAAEYDALASQRPHPEPAANIEMADPREPAGGSGEPAPGATNLSGPPGP